MLFLKKQFRKQSFIVPGQVIPVWFKLMGLGLGIFLVCDWCGGFVLFFSLIINAFETSHEIDWEWNNTNQ